MTKQKDSRRYYFQSDIHFDELYPASIQIHTKRHWTPLHIVRLAKSFLTSKPENKILDIGSGAGKFCLAAASYSPKSEFYGIEQRSHLVELATEVKKKLSLNNVNFIEGNFIEIDLRDFDHFYFYNSFFENLDDNARIDEDIEFSEDLYEAYVHHLRKELKKMPTGTKIVTYHSMQEEIPRGYKLVESFENGALNFWIKI